MRFVSLHNHSDHSLRDGFQSVEQMMSYASALGQTAIALTDHGTMSGCGEGFRYADKYGIKFIAGCEHYLVPDVTIKDKFNQHIILLAMNKQGYRNLNIITTLAHSENNFYFKPRIDLSILEKHNEGLICTTACIAGCQSKIKELKGIFGDRLYVEIHTNQLPEQKPANLQWLELADKYGVPFYAAVDAHYTLPTQSWFQRRWTGYAWEDDPDIYQTDDGWVDKDGKKVTPYSICDDYYLHTEEQVREALSYLPQDVVDIAVDTTEKVADMCDFKPDVGNNHYPKSQYSSPRDEVRMRVWNGMKEKGLKNDKKHIEQVRHELDILEKVDYFDYFIIVSDMLNYCRSHGIRTGVGRGSVVGCDVAYLMGITGIDPIKSGLIFERFAHTERVTPPDIDTDVPRAKRQDVIQYLKDTYGHVYQVVTFGKMAEKAAIRRACQALHISPDKTDMLAKSIDIDDINDIDNYPEPKNVFLPNEWDLFKKTVKQFYGKIQNFGTHASAVVVLTTDPYDFCAVERYKDSYNLNYDFHDLEEMGLLKLDILGLETLDIIEDVLSMIPEDKRPNVDNLVDGDSETYKLLCVSGRKGGLFQLEGSTVAKVMHQVQPKNLSDLTAIVALGRPAPMQSGMTDRYIIQKRNGGTLNGLICEDMLPLEVCRHLGDTYGCLVYQEQVMEIGRLVWGMSMGEADMLRRACARKDPELMKKLIADMKKRKNLLGLHEKQISYMLNVIGKASGYLFNKSHSAAYAYTAYQTAYLKAHYPLQFYCALLNSGIDQEKMVEYLSEIKVYGNVVSPPNIMNSDSKWSVKDNMLVAGFSSIRGVGKQNFVRPTDTSQESFEKFVENNSSINKQVLTNIVYACCFNIDPMYGRDYVDWYKEALKRKNECIERIGFFKDNSKKVAEWQEKLKQIPQPPDPNNYNTPLEQVRELQMSVLGYSTISPFSMYDKRMCNSYNKMIIVNKIARTSTRDKKPITYIDCTFQSTGRDERLIFYNPDADMMARLAKVKKNDVLIVSARMSNSGAFFGDDFVYANKVA